MTDTRLTPEVQSLLAEIAASNDPKLETLSPEEGRLAAAQALADRRGEPIPLAHVEDLTISGQGGLIPIRIYTPSSERPRPAMVYFHGGGWVVCDLDTHDNVCRHIADRSGAVVIAVDYRRAPEHPFPAAVNDCYSATQWVAANASNLGADPHRIAVGGDSAGGNLATVVALKCRGENGPELALQVLVYPVTNLASFDTPSYHEFAEGYYLSKSAMEWFRAHYLPHAEDGLNWQASPLLASDLSNLPPAVVITAECDVLRDEGEAYAERLAEAGVRVTLTRYPGVIHPFFSMPGYLPQSLEAIDQIASALAALPGADADG